ncbi:hypothetical protein [Aquamicrobium zhengzhouense]|nr:hypothetical protein [Aquamicrobium zhengzhouense]
MSAQEHFELYGKFENRAPSPFFDPVLYLRANPDVAEAVQGGLVNAFDHFMSFGQNEARSPSVFFDPSVYLRNNPDVAAAIEAGAFSSPFEHFLLYGQNEIRNTAPFFDLKGYLDANPDVAAAVRAGHTTAFDHFINHGFAEERDLGNGISLEQFASDPKALAAIQDGDYSALMSRVAEVAPFLPTYSPPAGYTVPSNTPLPADFVPAGEEKLVVPPGVEAPDVLPPNFQQPEPEPEPEPGEGGGGGGGGGTPTPDPIVLEFNKAKSYTDFIALIREHEVALGVTESLKNLPNEGGRINAVGMGVQEVRNLFGDFTTVDGIKAAVAKHIQTELNKQAALQGLYSTEDLETFVDLVTNLASDRAGIIDYYTTLATQTDSEAGHLRVDALEEELYTVALTKLAEAFGDPTEATKIFEEFQDVRGNYSGSIVTLVNKLYEAHAAADDDVAFLRSVNTADDEATVLAAIKTDPDFAALLEGTAFPDNGGREKAVALGVIETIEKLGYFSDVGDLREVIGLHIEMEQNKADFIAGAQVAQGEGFAATFEDLIRDLDLDRDTIINFWSNADDPEATARADELKADTFTVVLDQIVSHADTLGENDSTYWADLASAFDDINTEYTGSIVTLIGQLKDAHNEATSDPVY